MLQSVVCVVSRDVSSVSPTAVPPPALCQQCSRRGLRRPPRQPSVLPSPDPSVAFAALSLPGDHRILWGSVVLLIDGSFASASLSPPLPGALVLEGSRPHGLVRSVRSHGSDCHRVPQAPTSVSPAQTSVLNSTLKILLGPPLSGIHTTFQTWLVQNGTHGLCCICIPNDITCRLFRNPVECNSLSYPRLSALSLPPHTQSAGIACWLDLQNVPGIGSLLAIPSPAARSESRWLAWVSLASGFPASSIALSLCSPPSSWRETFKP